MEGFSIFTGNIVLKQHNLRSLFAVPYMCLLNQNVHVFNQRLLSNFSTFSSLQKGKTTGGVNSSKTTAKKVEGKTPQTPTSDTDESQSSDEKKKKIIKMKSLTIRPEISYNDYNTKIKQVQKFMEKGQSVALRVENPKNIDNAVDSILSKVQKSVTELQLSAKIVKTGHVINIYQVGTEQESMEKQQNSSSNLASGNKKKS